jgi:pimeloyl-ACP methyl ester carboxylesterase
MRTVASTDGVTVAVHDLGGSGAPLLLAHATGFHALVWRPLVAHLDGFHAWAPDLRGHGDSSPPLGGTFHWSGFADDVLAVVDALGLDRPFAAGHSKGGAALLLAEQRRPGTFAGLYLYEPVVFPSEVSARLTGENPLAEGARRRRDTFDSFDAAFENFASKPPFSALDPDALRAYVDHGFAQRADGTVRLKCRPEHEAEMYRMGSAHDAFAHLDRVSCPVVVAAGRTGEYGPATFTNAIVAALPDGQKQDWPQLGHFGPLERPDLIASAIEQAFLPAGGPGLPAGRPGSRPRP